MILGLLVERCFVTKRAISSSDRKVKYLNWVRNLPNQVTPQILV